MFIRPTSIFRCTEEVALENMASTGVGLFVLFAFLGVIRATEEDLTIEVKPGGVECFWQSLKRPTITEIEYQVSYHSVKNPA